MRILLVLNAFEEDGPGLLMWNLCRLWQKNPGLEVRVVALSRGGALQQRFEALGISTEVFPTRTVAGFRAFGHSLKRLHRLGQAPDVIHTNLLWPDLVCRYFRRFTPAAKLVSTCHGLHAVGEMRFPFGLLYTAIEKLTRGRCNGWVAVSEFVAKELEQSGIRRSAIQSIPNGIDCARFSPASKESRLRLRKRLGIAPNQPLLLAVGNFRPVKNHVLLLESMVLIKSTIPDAVLVLVGRGPLKGEYARMIRERNLQGSVRLMSPKDKLLPVLMSAANLFVHTSHTESFGLVVAEALACETPVVATRVGALPELVVDGITGALVEPDRILPLATTVCALLAEPDACKRMGVAGRLHVLKNFRIEQTAERYWQYWQRL